MTETALEVIEVLESDPMIRKTLDSMGAYERKLLEERLASVVPARKTDDSTEELRRALSRLEDIEDDLRDAKYELSDIKAVIRDASDQ